MSEDHEALVWGPAAEGDRTASGRVVRKGWVWTCPCGGFGDGYASEDDAEFGVDRWHNIKQVS